MTDVGIEGFLARMRLSGSSAESIGSRRRFLRRLDAALPVPLGDATAAHLAAWRESLTVGDRALNCYVSYARTYYRWLIDEGARIDNPAGRLLVPRLGRLLPRPISDADLADALAAAPPRIRIWLVLACWCGLRAKEIALLRRESIIDTARSPLLIVTAIATKGHAEERSIPLCPFVLGELAIYGLPASGYAFRRLDGALGPNTAQRVSQIASDYLHSRDISATFHMGRHWFGTGAYGATRDLRLVQELLGHKSPLSTAGYAAYDSSSAAAAVQALPLPEQLLRAAG
jgi:integrase/recombinase XerC